MGSLCLYIRDETQTSQRYQQFWAVIWLINGINTIFFIENRNTIEIIADKNIIFA